MTDRPKLEACPFCGGQVDPNGWLRNDGVRGPECEQCGATAESIEAWNTRTPDTERERRAFEAQELLAEIYRRYLDNNLDECRPEWGRGLEEDLATELFCGRGGRGLITLRDCFTAYQQSQKEGK